MPESLAVRIRCQRAPFVVASLILAVLGLAPVPRRARSAPNATASGAPVGPFPRRHLVVLRDTEDPETAAAVVQAIGTWASASRVPQRRSRLLQSKRRRPARAPWPAILVLPWSRRMGLFIRPVGKRWTLGTAGVWIV